jgi:hypothetical protein
VRQVQVFVAGPVLVQAAFASQPPLFTAQLFTGVHDLPLPLYPALHAHVLVPGPVLAQEAFRSQPPLSVAHESMGVHTTPLPA